MKKGMKHTRETRLRMAEAQNRRYIEKRRLQREQKMAETSLIAMALSIVTGAVAWARMKLGV